MGRVVARRMGWGVAGCARALDARALGRKVEGGGHVWLLFRSRSGRWAE